MYLTNINIDNNVVDAIGIFKSELQSDFLQFEEKDTHLEMILQQGINLSKLDKGCLIFNYKKEEGYKIKYTATEGGRCNLICPIKSDTLIGSIRCSGCENNIHIKNYINK